MAMAPANHLICQDARRLLDWVAVDAGRDCRKRDRSGSDVPCCIKRPGDCGAEQALVVLSLPLDRTGNMNHVVSGHVSCGRHCGGAGLERAIRVHPTV